MVVVDADISLQNPVVGGELVINLRDVRRMCCQWEDFDHHITGRLEDICRTKRRPKKERERRPDPFTISKLLEPRLQEPARSY
jgi:hypothetical protein